MEEILLLNYIKGLVEKIKSSEKGQGMVEYALIIAFVAAIAIMVFNENGLGGVIGSAFSNASDMVDAAASQASAISEGT